MTNGQTQTSSDLKFVDEKFEVIPAPAQIRQPGEDAVGPAGPTPGEPGRFMRSGLDYSEEDLMFMSETIWSLPNLVWDKLPERDPEKLRKWNAQLYRYSVKKGINPFEWFFDELPLALATVGLAGGAYRDYKEVYGKNGKDARSKEDKKLSSDYDHEKEIAEKKEQDIKSGAISTAPPAS